MSEQSVEDFVASMNASEEVKATVKKNLDALSSHEKTPKGLFDEKGQLRVPKAPRKPFDPEPDEPMPVLPVWLECPKCHRRWLHTHGRNRKVRCKKCGGTVRIPKNVVQNAKPVESPQMEPQPDPKPRGIRHDFEHDSPRMVELLKEGKTGIQICGEMGISSGTLYLWKKKLGLLGLSIPSSGSGPAQKNAGAQGTGEPEASPGKERHTSVLERDLPFGYYLEIAERFVNFLEINHRASFLKFQELETEKGTSRDDLDRALEIAFRMNKLGVLH